MTDLTFMMVIALYQLLCAQTVVLWTERFRAASVILALMLVPLAVIAYSSPDKVLQPWVLAPLPIGAFSLGWSLVEHRRQAAQPRKNAQGGYYQAALAVGYRHQLDRRPGAGARPPARLNEDERRRVQRALTELPSTAAMAPARLLLQALLRGRSSPYGGIRRTRAQPALSTEKPMPRPAPSGRRGVVRTSVLPAAASTLRLLAKFPDGRFDVVDPRRPPWRVHQAGAGGNRIGLLDGPASDAAEPLRRAGSAV